jgi:hypothetical protein
MSVEHRRQALECGLATRPRIEGWNALVVGHDGCELVVMIAGDVCDAGFPANIRWAGEPGKRTSR